MNIRLRCRIETIVQFCMGKIRSLVVKDPKLTCFMYNIQYREIVRSDTDPTCRTANNLLSNQFSFDRDRVIVRKIESNLNLKSFRSLFVNTMPRRDLYSCRD